MKHKIVISCDTPDAEQFCDYLNALGHDAEIGDSTGNYVDGTWTSADETANAIMRQMWVDFCDQHES